MIKIENLTKQFKKDKGIFDINLAFEKGQIYGLIGENGAGKTTLIKLMTGFLMPESGKIEGVLDKVQPLKNVGYLPDFNFLLPTTVQKNINFFTRFNDMDMKMIDEMIDDFAIDRKEKIANLSTGKQKALSFILTICKNADIYILDEPFSSIDIITRNKMIKHILNDIDIIDKTILLSSHELNEMENLLDNVVMIKNGRVEGVYDVTTIKEENNTTLYDWYIQKYS